VRDLGERLGCGAHVTALRRLWVEPFSMPQMRNFKELDALAAADPAALDACLLPLEQGLVGYPAVRLDTARAARLRQGQAIEIDATVVAGRCIALDEAGRAVALAETDAAGRLRSLRGFNPC
jgi:tRNA pseudouridine55 synthase